MSSDTANCQFVREPSTLEHPSQSCQRGLQGENDEAWVDNLLIVGYLFVLLEHLSLVVYYRLSGSSILAVQTPLISCRPHSSGCREVSGPDDRLNLLHDAFHHVNRVRVNQNLNLNLRHALSGKNPPIYFTYVSARV